LDTKPFISNIVSLTSLLLGQKTIAASSDPVFLFATEVTATNVGFIPSI